MAYGLSMDESILVSIKKLLGITEDDPNFDTDIIMHINTSLSVLHQLGIGPKNGFSISDSSSVWSEFISEDRFNSVKTYIFMTVKLIFDPPSQGSALETMKEYKKELEWRLKVAGETNEEDESNSSEMDD